MLLLSPEDVLLRIAEAREALDAPDAAVAFDGDGTLWRGDIGEDFFHATVETARFLPPAVRAMVELGQQLKVDTGPGEGVLVAKRLFQGYLDQRVPEDTICEVIAWTCAGWTEGEVYAHARNVVRLGALEGRVHDEMRVILEGVRAAGLRAILVSASPRPVVEAAGALLGFARADVLAVTAPFEGGVMLPTVERPIPYGPGKVRQLEASLGAQPLVAAFGDNVFDLPMLRAARVAVAVDPKPRLLAELRRMDGEGGDPSIVSLPGLVRLEIRARP